MKIRDYRQFSDFLLCLACIWSLIAYVSSEDTPDTSSDIINKTTNQKDETAQGVKDSRGLFSPRMDYEQWKPLGRGDPLKNDPTYDYVPPVLDRVHYWIDSASRKPDPDMKKTEILVLGVSSKKPSTSFSTVADNRRDTFDSFDPFLKFVEGSNYNIQNYQRRPQYAMSQNYYSSTFYNSNKGEQKEPYTMLVPPPMPTHEQSYQQPVMSSTSTTTPITMAITATTSSSVAIEEANLVYQASSLSTTDEWKGSNTYATIAESSSQVTWRTPPESNNTKKTAQQLPTLKAPENFKDTYSIVPSLVVMNSKSKLQNTQNMETDIIIGPEMAMHKGQVTDDTLDLSSTYVSIGKPDASIQPATGMGMDVIPMMGQNMKQNNMLLNSPLLSSVINPMISPSSHSMFRKHPSPMKKLEMNPMTLQTMQTMLPPPATHMMLKKPLLHHLLKKESTPPTITTTITPPTTTSVSSLTTDPLFKHYKQPNEPMRGPMYLIIQGHSKVKTYGPSKQINGISVQETNEIPTSDDRQTEYPVKHLHELMKENREEWDREKRDNRQGRLQTLSHLLVSGLGALGFGDGQGRRSDDDVKETELIVKYDVSSGEDVTSEVYHKGIVESEIPPNRKDRPQALSLTLA